MVFTSLLHIRESQLADPVGGGFHRYAKRAGWQEPAWEKMLADNAALAMVYLDASEQAASAELAETGRLAVEFLLGSLRLPCGAFAASIDAVSRDASGAECDGCYYAMSDELRLEALRSPPAREHAFEERKLRPAPLRDERILADGNALAISVLVRAAKVLGEPRYLEAARSAAAFVDAKLTDRGFVRHCAYADGRSCSDGYLSDQALVALAFLDLGEATGETQWLDAARAIADGLPARFEHQGQGGFFLTSNDSPPLPLRYKNPVDTAVAGGNSAAAMLYVRLAARTGEARYADLARRTFLAFSEILTLRPLALPAMVSALAAQKKSAD